MASVAHPVLGNRARHQLTATADIGESLEMYLGRFPAWYVLVRYLPKLQCTSPVSVQTQDRSRTLDLLRIESRPVTKRPSNGLKAPHPARYPFELVSKETWLKVIPNYPSNPKDSGIPSSSQHPVRLLDFLSSGRPMRPPD